MREGDGLARDGRSRARIGGGGSVDGRSLAQATRGRAAGDGAQRKREETEEREAAKKAKASHGGMMCFSRANESSRKQEKLMCHRVPE
jgi:hypothetical protein